MGIFSMSNGRKDDMKTMLKTLAMIFAYACLVMLTAVFVLAIVSRESRPEICYTCQTLQEKELPHVKTP